MSLIGKKLLLRYESGLQVEGHYASPTEVRWKAVTGPAEGKTGTEKTRIVEVAPEVFFVSWLEASGTTVSQVLDLNRRTVTAFVTFDAGGGRQALHDSGSVTELPSD